MTLKEVLNLNVKEDKDFFINLLKGFSKDFEIYKEDTYKLYSDMFGNEELFEEIQDNIQILNEELKNGTLLLEDGPMTQKDIIAQERQRALERIEQLKKSPNAKVIQKTLPDGTKSTLTVGTLGINADKKNVVPSVVSPSSNVEVKKNIFSKMLEGAKNWISGLTSKFPKLGNFLSKGLDWIVANPLAVAGIAGGSLLLGKLIKTLKKRGEEKKAANLQAALDKSKGVKQ